MTRGGWILITSGTKRLGLAMAHSSLKLGFNVILQYRTSAQPGLRTLTRNKEYIGRVHFVQWDLTPANAAAFIQEISKVGPLCGLVNNASVFVPGDLNDSGAFESAHDSNTLVPLALSRAFVKNRTAAWILNVTDAHIDTVLPRYQNYRISKLWLEQLTAQMAVLWAPRIRVNAIAPGAILPASSGETTPFALLREKIPLGRTGKLSDISKGFEFLVTTDYVTGQTLYIDGGWHLVP